MEPDPVVVVKPEINKISEINKESVNVPIESVSSKVTESNINIKETVKLTPEMEKLQQIRISNTLSRFSKQDTLKLRKDFEGLNSLLMDPDISQFVSIILDGELKAASDEYIIFVLETENSAKIFNENLVSIEAVLKKFLEKEYKVIGVEGTEWSKIKDDFNHKSKVFEYIPEPEIKLSYKKKEQFPDNDIEKIFGEVVEYEN